MGWRVVLILAIILVGAVNGNAYDENDTHGQRQRDASDQGAYYQMIGDILGGKPSYYAVLGLERDDEKPVSSSEVRRAYRKLAVQMHPDKVKEKDRGASTEEEWTLVNFAKEVLGDEGLRRQYHSLLDHGVPLTDKYYGRHAHRLGLHLDARILLVLAAIAFITADHLVRRTTHRHYVQRARAHGTFKSLQRNAEAPLEIEITGAEAPRFSTLLPFRVARTLFGILLFLASPLVDFYRHTIRGEKRLTKADLIKLAEEEERAQLQMTIGQYNRFKHERIEQRKEAERQVLASNKFKQYRRMMRKYQ